MIVFPNCKINIGLRITGKRPDGFHNIETIFYPLPLHDALEAVPSGNFSFSQYGLDIRADENICVKAYEIFRTKYKTPEVDIHLLKSIPAGAGLGGGSSDGAFMLKLLAALSPDKPGINTLKEMALQLGSDCPFFLENKAVLASGRGEIFTPVNLDLRGFYITIINPGIHISTADAFRSISTFSEQGSLVNISSDPETWRNVVFNDFESSAFVNFPEIGKAKSHLYEKGAVYAAMTGTGSTVFGIFKNWYQPSSFPQSWFVRCFSL